MGLQLVLLLAYRFLCCQRQTAKTATLSDKTATTITLVIEAVAEMSGGGISPVVGQQQGGQ